MDGYVDDNRDPLKGFKSGNKPHQACIQRTPTASWVLYGDGGEVRLREEITDVRPVHSQASITPGNAQTP